MLSARIWLSGKTRLCNVRFRSFLAVQPATTQTYTLRAIRKNKSKVGDSFNTYIEKPLATQRPRYSATHTLFRRLLKAIRSSDDQQVITSLITENFNQFINKFSCSGHIYDKIIRFILKRSCIAAAIAVHNRVVSEGFILSPSIRGRILVVSSFTTRRSRRTGLPPPLRRIIEDECFTLHDLGEVCESMESMKLPHEMVQEALITFLNSHPSPRQLQLDPRSYKRIIRLGAQDGNFEPALDSLAVLPRSDAEKAVLSSGYASLFSAIRRSVYPDRNVINAAVDQMQRQGIQPNLAAWNALIAFEVRTKSLHRPFAIYEALKNQSGLLPDEYTFGSLFNALNNYYVPLRRGYRRGEPLPPDILSPRALYRDMIQALARKSTDEEFHLSTSLLNVVLRPFIYSRDYAGAYVVIRAFYTFNIPPNIKTYFIVIRHLMNRITYGIRAIRTMGADTWADRFLGLPHPIKNPKFLAEFRLGNELTRHILNISKRESFKHDTPLYVTNPADPLQELGPDKYLTPTVEALLGKEETLLSQGFSVVPLERLLKKALLAESKSMREFIGRHEGATCLSRTIRDVRTEMVPQGLQPIIKKLRQRMTKTRKSIQASTICINGFVFHRVD